jgi:hypothetical protein
VRKLITRYAIGLLVVAALSALWAILDRAEFSMAWLVFLPALIALYLFGEWVFEPIFSPQTGLAISQSRFSALRIATGLLFVLPAFVISIAAAWVVRAWA